jgi:ABC-type glycerol-3-phosphate transport system permease component
MTNLLAYIVLIAWLTAVLLPFFWMVSTSLKSYGEVFKIPIKWFPIPPRWKNYPAALTFVPFKIYFKNSLIITLSCVLGEVLVSSIVAFGFARTKFIGREIWFVILLATMMLPGQVTLIPVYIIFKNLGWLNTFKPLIVPSYFGGAFYIFLLRQFFMTIPIELDQAARIDGCGDFGIFWHILLPLIKPPLVAVSLFSFIGHWNDYFGPLIYLSSVKKYTVGLGLTLFQGTYFNAWHYLMAASVAAMLPCIILFAIGQKYFIQGIVLTGLKG